MEGLAERFEADRQHLRAVAYRMLGSVPEADDAVQEAWLRVSRTDMSGVANLSAWLTTVVGRVALDMLRTRRARREEPHGVHPPPNAPGGTDPEAEVLLADAVGPALLVVLDTLAPAERVAFVLHDTFGVPFDDIAAVVGRSTAAVRQLASRARRRVRGAPEPAADHARQRSIVAAFLAASRGGDLVGLVALLDPSVVLRADAVTVAAGAEPEVRGAAAVARTFAGRARGGRAALLGGVPGVVWGPGGTPKVVFVFTFVEDRITGIELVAAPDRMAEMEVEFI
ncbi:sigma-70 family RNA polymerase sigma factor [Actinophytocola xanthii]|uniref:RNA polymerase subunit sigma-70 n=1 Tax=Actinophytocola xanthii TaxID=1912961 RepID=A0A1Q8CNQ5_9PSEU|nr:sigma-70 family RNA polymerase sigma factor [Actinophytocola xanthii]OLF15995.1 RNA polymerase subunit sigma-70 [Actinophytocola xanthii]